MQRFHAGVRKFKTKSGQPMLLTPNWGIGGSQRYDDPEVLAVGNASDGALSECGFTGCASAVPRCPSFLLCSADPRPFAAGNLATGSEWEQKVKFMLNLQKGGKAYMDNSYWACNSTNAPRSHPKGWGAPLAMNRSSISYILASCESCRSLCLSQKTY